MFRMNPHGPFAPRFFSFFIPSSSSSLGTQIQVASTTALPHIPYISRLPHVLLVISPSITGLAFAFGSSHSFLPLISFPFSRFFALFAYHHLTDLTAYTYPSLRSFCLPFFHSALHSSFSFPVSHLSSLFIRSSFIPLISHGPSYRQDRIKEIS